MNIPDIGVLKSVSQSLAILDAIIMQDWEHRYYSYNIHWSPGREMASMRDGSGDHYFVLFTPDGCIAKGFCKGVALAKETAYGGVPQVFEVPFLQEPAFLLDDVSFAFWRLNPDAQWTHRPLLDQARTCTDSLLGVLTGQPEDYLRWAERYYEREISSDAVRLVYQHEPLNGHIVRKLNPNADKDQLVSDALEIGYPYSI